MEKWSIAVMRELVYGERGILHRIEQGDEDRVVSAEKLFLIEMAKETNQRYHAGTLTNDELLIYLDIFDVFASFQHVDWIRDMTAEMHSILTKGTKHV
ncbi:MAG: hypothetical protein IJB04_00265 [Oscillospiraceae bacterium]|nr:hypothetical protein [Oscillospiraceae bacterium]